MALTIVIIYILISILISFYKKGLGLEYFSLTLIIVGAISNLIDRLRYGYVVDYIDVKFFSVFNIADSMITIGIILIVIKELLFKKSWANVER